MNIPYTPIAVSTSYIPSDQEFSETILRFWAQKRNPESYPFWSPSRCRDLLPLFYFHYQIYMNSRDTLDLISSSQR